MWKHGVEAAKLVTGTDSEVSPSSPHIGTPLIYKQVKSIRSGVCVCSSNLLHLSW